MYFPEGTHVWARLGDSFSTCPPNIPHLTCLCVPLVSPSPCCPVGQVCSPSCSNWRTQMSQLSQAQEEAVALCHVVGLWGGGREPPQSWGGAARHMEGS